MDAKHAVHEFWNTASCGEHGYALGPDEHARLAAHAAARYQLEPYLKPFARFADGRGKDVLEIGVGMGADHLEWAKSHPRSLTGIDLTERAIGFTCARLNHAAHHTGNHADITTYHAGFTSQTYVADAENLPFSDQSFDLIYSWGVLHHSPDTAKAFAEAARVLRPCGTARIMIYHTFSLTGLMLWARYGLLKGRPFLPLATVYSRYLESPGTKAYSVRQARKLCQNAGFRHVRIRIQLNHGDLLQGTVGQRHQGRLLSWAMRLWPRWFFRTFTPFLGLYLLIDAEK